MAIQTAHQQENRWYTIQDIWANNQWLFVVMGYFIGLLTFPALQEVVTNLMGLLSGFVPEAVGIGFTVLFIDRLNRHREEKRRVEDLKAQLVREVGSPDNATALNAVRELKAHGWLTGWDGLLKYVDLMEANLAEADLYEANLIGATLSKANLGGAILHSANLESASLWYADLEGAILHSVNLQGAILNYANLTGATLSEANLQSAVLPSANLAGADLWEANLAGVLLYECNLVGANLFGANLAGVNLKKAIFDDKIVLPDAIYNHQTKTYDKYWTPDTDMTRYTDPDHPDFWQPDWAKRDNTDE